MCDFICPFDNCDYIASGVLKLKTHIRFHSNKTILDYSFNHGLMTSDNDIINIKNAENHILEKITKQNEVPA